jgi:hypothetical protein
VTWLSGPWYSIGESGIDQRTPDISPIIQEIIDRPGWEAGNSVMIRIDGFGQRIAQSFDKDPTAAPTLHVEFLTMFNAPPVVDILAPVPGGKSEKDAVIPFNGTAIDDEDGDLSASIEWYSNLDGILGMGSNISTSLSVGIHTIIASVDDVQGATGIDQISVSVFESLIDIPDVTGQLQATAESNLVAAGLTVGTVTTQASETVAAGDVISQSPVACMACATSGDPVDLVVSSGPANIAPTIQITSPENRSVILVGAPVLLSASANDTEDGPITGNIVWVSSKSGELGTGATLTVDLLVGRHEITATVTDSGGLQDTDSIRVRISKK